MSSFTEFDAFEQIGGGTRYRLRAALVWDVGRKGSDWFLIVAPQTIFDLSVPRCLRWLLSPHDRIWLPAAAVHDHLLERGYDRAFAAAEFRRAVAARVERAIKDGRIKRDRRVWIAFWLVLLWTVRGGWRGAGAGAQA